MSADPKTTRRIEKAMADAVQAFKAKDRAQRLLDEAVSTLYSAGFRPEAVNAALRISDSDPADVFEIVSEAQQLLDAVQAPCQITYANAAETADQGEEAQARAAHFAGYWRRVKGGKRVMPTDIETAEARKAWYKGYDAADCALSEA
jgi:hypothetical protein